MTAPSWLTETRLKRRHSLGTLSEALGTAPQVVHKWETGERPIPAAMIAPLAGLLRVDPWALELFSGRIPGDLAERARDDASRLAKTLRRSTGIPVSA